MARLVGEGFQHLRVPAPSQDGGIQGSLGSITFFPCGREVPVVFLFDGLKVLCAFSSFLFISSPLLSLRCLYTRFHSNHLYCIPDCEEKSCRCE